MNKTKQNLIFFLIILVFGVFATTLYFREQLPLYIHPRYIRTSFVSGIFSIIIGVIGFVYNLLQIKNLNTKEEHSHSIQLSSIIPMTFILLSCLLIPAKSLTSATASQRSIDVNALANKSDLQLQTNAFENFSVDTEKYSIGDWISITRSSNDLTSFRDKKAIVSGFIFHPEELDTGKFMVARFVVTCCAVDARPVGLIVEKDLNNTDFKEDDWVEINGKFDIQTIDGKSTLILIPDQIKKISKPSYQYLF